jgi:Flp pilus assembly pilin Flp
MLVIGRVFRLTVNQLRWPSQSAPAMCAAAALSRFPKGEHAMLKVYFEARELVGRFRTDKDGVVSFEYVIVAACIVAAVAIAFGTGTGGNIATALKTAIGDITNAVTAAAAQA